MSFVAEMLLETPKFDKPRAGRLAVAAFFCCCVASPFLASGCATTGANAAARNAEGVSLFASGDYDGAIAVFDESLKLNPNNAEAYYNLGSAYQRKALATGNAELLAQAENCYWAALEQNPAPETIVCCYRGIATSATTRGDVDGALQALEDWRDRNPESIEPQLEIAYLLEAQERDDEAFETLQKVAEAAPNDYRAHYKMSVLQERAGNVEEALVQMKIAGKLNPTDEALAKRATRLQAALAKVKRGGTLDENVVATGEETTLVAPTSASALETPADASSPSATGAPSTGANDAPKLPPELENPTGGIDSAPNSGGANPNDSGSASETTSASTRTVPRTNGATLATQTLDENEVALFVAPEASASLGEQFAQNGESGRTLTDDSGVRWTSPTGETVAEIPTTVQPASQSAQSAATGSANSTQIALVAQNPDATTDASTNAQTPAQSAAESTSNAPTPASTPRAKKTLGKPRARYRTEMNAGPPSMRAGSLF